MLAIWGGVVAALIVRDIRTGQAVLQNIDLTVLNTQGGVSRAVRAGARRLDSADRLARSSLPFVVARAVPLLGTQVAELRSLTGTARSLGAFAQEAADEVQDKLDGGTAGASARSSIMATIVTELDEAKRQVDGVRVSDRTGVVWPVSSARDTLRRSLDKARTKLADGVRLTSALRRFLEGPSRELVLASNNAEMRAGGMPLSAGVAEIAGAGFTLGGFVQTSALYLHPDRVPVSDEHRQLYGWLNVGQEWRTTSSSPNFPAVAPIFAQMSAKSALGPVDGVMMVDILTLKVILAATGPVELDGTTYTYENVEQRVQNENYLDFGAADAATRAARAEVQSQLGAAVFSALNTRPVELGTLVAGLKAAAESRHFLAWSPDPDLQELWVKLNADGGLDPDGIRVDFENISANKLDWYITPRLSLARVGGDDENDLMRLTISVTNPKRPETSPVVEGTVYAKVNGFRPGEHRSFVVIGLPRTAHAIRSSDPPISGIGRDGPMMMATMHLSVIEGQTREAAVTFKVPKGQRFKLLPMARAHTVAILTPEGRWNDVKPQWIEV